MSTPETIDSIRFLEQELERLLSWCRAAESRVALILPLATALLGSLAVLSPDRGQWSHEEVLFVTLAAALLICSICATWGATFPRVTGPKGSLIYFGTITDRSLEQYRSKVKNLPKSEYVDDLAEQCYRNAEIAKAKHAWMKKAMVALFLGGACWIVSIVLILVG